jgi:hypothetical protein
MGEQKELTKKGYRWGLSAVQLELQKVFTEEKHAFGTVEEGIEMLKGMGAWMDNEHLSVQAQVEGAARLAVELVRFLGSIHDAPDLISQITEESNEKPV